MNGVLTIDSFHAQLTSPTTEHPLLAAVRKLMGLDRQALLAELQTLGGWTGWYY